MDEIEDEDVGEDNEGVPVVKAHFIDRDGSEVQTSRTPQGTLDIFQTQNALEPPLDPIELASLFELSGGLRVNIDTYATNVDGYGHEFEPVLDLEDEDTREMVRQAILEEKVHHAMAQVDGSTAEKATGVMDVLRRRVLKLALGEDIEGGDDVDLDIEVTDAEVEECMSELATTLVWEHRMLVQFFDFCCVEQSFTKLRAITRQDIEVLGNGFWEVIRNTRGEPVQFVYVPAFSIRLMPQDPETTQVQLPIQRTVLRVDDEPVNRRFRRYIQVLSGTKLVTYFKDYGDPRTVSTRSGKYYTNVQELEKAEPGVRAANELIHFKIHSSRTPYGIPRWVSELLAVLGNRHAAEINLAYFENKSIPPLAILVSGGRLAKNEVNKVRDYIKNEIRGKKNFHKILILQAEPFGNELSGTMSGSVKIEIKPLTSTQQDDGLFMKYQEQNEDRIGGVFRVPRLLRGDVRDFNRATAEASLHFAEQQVFSPLRKDFDWWINRFVLPSLGIRLHKFRSRGPDMTDLAVLGEQLAAAATSGFLNMRELREIAARVFGRKFKALDGEESEVPLEFLRLGLAEVEDDGEDLPVDPTEDTPEQASKRAGRRKRARGALKLLALETHFQELARSQARAKFAAVPGV